MKTSPLFKTEITLYWFVSPTGCLIFQTEMFTFTLPLSTTSEMFRWKTYVMLRTKTFGTFGIFIVGRQHQSDSGDFPG